MNALSILNPPKFEPDEPLIETLSGLLRAAQEGKIVSVSFVVETPEEVYWLTTGAEVNEGEHVAGLERLKYGLLFGGCENV